MKDSSFERFCSFDAFYDASYRVCRNVRWKDSVIDFEERRIDQILQTEEDLRNNEYEQLVFSCFQVIERGKQRDIRACHIDDRLVQNTLCEQVLLPEITPKFIYDNCATLKGRGIDFALNRMKKRLKAAQRNYDGDFYGARIDISKYFDSLDHESLKESVSKVITDERVRELVYYLIDTFCFKVTKDTVREKGKTYYIVSNNEYKVWKGNHLNPKRQYFEYSPRSLGLGSQVSQLLALLALNGVDHFIKEVLHIKYYGRYMDDLYLIHNDSAYLHECLRRIEEKLNECGLHMNPKKSTVTRIHPIGSDGKRKAPFKYLKWNFYITDTNKVIQIPFKSKVAKQRRKLRKMAELWREGKLPTEEVQQSYQGWRAHIKKGTTFYIVQKMDNYFNELFKGVPIL